MRSITLLALASCRYDGPTYITYCPEDTATSTDTSAPADSSAEGEESPLDSVDTSTGAEADDDSGDGAPDSGDGSPDSGDSGDSDDGDTAGSGGCTAPFTCIDLTGVVNTDHSNSPWTEDPSESFDVAPGVAEWQVADGSTIPFVIIDPAANAQMSMIATKGGEDWRPSYAFPELFEIDGGGASGSRVHLAGLASGWSDPTYFTGVAATLTVEFADGVIQVIELANGTNLDDWNHTWHSASSPDAVRVYEDTTYGRHIDALSVTLDSSSSITRLVLEDSSDVHTGTAEKTSVALFSITIES